MLFLFSIIMGLISLLFGLFLFFGHIAVLRNPDKYRKNAREESSEGSPFLINNSDEEAKIKGKRSKVTCILFILLSLGLIAAGGWLLFDTVGELIDSLDSGDSGGYETNYLDENGNGELDQGEWNYTVDENGNIVDIDDDGSNFE